MVSYHFDFKEVIQGGTSLQRNSPRSYIFQTGLKRKSAMLGCSVRAREIASVTMYPDPGRISSRPLIQLPNHPLRNNQIRARSFEQTNPGDLTKSNERRGV